MNNWYAAWMVCVGLVATAAAAPPPVAQSRAAAPASRELVQQLADVRATFLSLQPATPIAASRQPVNRNLTLEGSSTGNPAGTPVTPVRSPDVHFTYACPGGGDASGTQQLTTAGAVITAESASQFNNCRLGAAPDTRQIAGAMSITVTRSPELQVMVENGTVTLSGYPQNGTFVFNNLTMSTTIPTAANGYAPPQVTITGTITVGGYVFVVTPDNFGWLSL
jgi:hypothetical protein